MNSEDTRQLIEDFFLVLMSKDNSRLRDLLAPDVVWQMPRSLPDNRHEGIDRVVAELGADTVKRTFAKGSFCLAIDQIYVDGPVAIVRQHVSALTKDGRPYAMEYCFIYSFRDGKIERIDEFLDTQLAFTTLGLVDPDAPTPTP